MGCALCSPSSWPGTGCLPLPSPAPGSLGYPLPQFPSQCTFGQALGTFSWAAWFVPDFKPTSPRSLSGPGLRSPGCGNVTASREMPPMVLLKQ